MFRWKKRDEGFEWHQYVRTTIKLRREARRDKAEQLGRQAAEGARAAGVAAGRAAQEGARVAGAAAGRAARSGARQAKWIGRATLARAGDVAVAVLGATGLLVGHLVRRLGYLIEGACDVLGRPGVAGPLMLAGAIALMAGVVRAWLLGRGVDSEAWWAIAIGSICLTLGLAPALWLGHSRLRLAMPRVGLPFSKVALGNKGTLAVGTGLVAALAGGAVLLVQQGGVKLPSMPGLASLPSLPSVPSITGSEVIEGRASVLAADLLRIDDRTIRISGIDAPEPRQRCSRAGNRTWRCGAAAQDAMTRLVRRKTVRCDVGVAGADGVSVGVCHVGETDLAAELVRGGHVFAQEGFFSKYESLEGEARDARAGVWVVEDPERPAAWRAKKWAAAKKRAPDGCPIKGRVSRGERVYLLPWSNRYDRERVRARRGDRWFCSEAEALAAGWRSAEAG